LKSFGKTDGYIYNGRRSRMRRASNRTTTSTAERAYEPPKLQALGSVEELTTMPVPKLGTKPDGLVMTKGELVNASP
jgi:hypothetical protein